MPIDKMTNDPRQTMGMEHSYVAEHSANPATAQRVILRSEATKDLALTDVKASLRARSFALGHPSELRMAPDAVWWWGQKEV